VSRLGRAERLCRGRSQPELPRPGLQRGPTGQSGPSRDARGSHSPRDTRKGLSEMVLHHRRNKSFLPHERTPLLQTLVRSPFQS